MSVRNVTTGILDKSVRGPLGVYVSDAPLERPLPFGPDWPEYLRTQVKYPDAAMNEVLRCLNLIRDRKPFDQELWSEFAEIGQSILPNVSERLRDGFLRVTASDRKRRIDALHVCRTRMSILELLAQKDPHAALKKVVFELGTLPYKDTFVRSPRAVRKSFSPSPDEWALYAVYRMNLELLYAELVQATNHHADRGALLWGVADASRTAIQKCVGQREMDGDRSAASMGEALVEIGGEAEVQAEQDAEEELVLVG